MPWQSRGWHCQAFSDQGSWLRRFSEFQLFEMSTNISKRPLNPEPREQYRIAIPAQGAGDI